MMTADGSVATPRLAIILAAGLGMRLRSLRADVPKGLVPVGGEPLVGRSLRLLRECGIDRVVLVTGYRAEAYAEFLAAQFPAVVRAHNPDYARTGSMHSLAAAAGHVDGEFLLLESDLLYERRALTALLRRPAGDCVLLSGATGQGDEVFAYGAAGRLASLSKTRRADLAPLGELVGISRLTPELFRALLAHYAAHVPFPSNYHYDDALSDLAAAHPIAVEKVDDLVWAEIDDPAHHERAVARVWPALRKLENHDAGPA